MVTDNGGPVVLPILWSDRVTVGSVAFKTVTQRKNSAGLKMSNGHGSRLRDCLENRQQPCHGPWAIASLQLGTVLHVTCWEKAHLPCEAAVVPENHWFFPPESSLGMTLPPPPLAERRKIHANTSAIKGGQKCLYWQSEPISVPDYEGLANYKAVGAHDQAINATGRARIALRREGRDCLGVFSRDARAVHPHLKHFYHICNGENVTLSTQAYVEFVAP
ncbi:hypothetical protein C8F04DRAFT_1229941 [Mycena alexandri]|uniref:Uncharacterized protein n=1 Tax=Mycena alexandri TaxID=1745969 RepID=A0AAD6TD86_9AGAR|nr:hypothetical protein C8F04DRAFT_1229941 [Mycena alexandri]